MSTSLYVPDRAALCFGQWLAFVPNSVCVVGSWPPKGGIYFDQHLCICPGEGMIALLALKVGDLMAAVLSIASAKGGCSKTTITVGIGVELALDGYIVVVLDADLNQHATKFGEKANIPNFTVIGEVSEGNILQQMK